MLLLENILSQEVVQKLGWTLLHFVWQATAAALLLAILLRLLRKSTADLRYITACFALGLIVLLPIITIQLVPVSASYSSGHIELPTVSTVSPAETIEVSAAETPALEEPAPPESIPTAPALSWKQRTTELLEPALPCIVLGWLLGVFALSIWHLGGWAQLQRLRRKMVKQVDYMLLSKLSQLAERLAVKRAVQLMESALVQVPTIVGWLRPVILLPAIALTGLSTEQLEALLAHELAHIKRFDYLVNILQTVVEILGFYHLAVWWVSHKIRVERENCCDDLAVSISGDRVCYARALTSMEEIRVGRGQLAVAAAGGSLFRRICRLVGKDSPETNRFSFIPAATAIILIMALVIPTAFALTNRTTNKSDLDIETKLLDGFRENRDKFKCGILAWTRTTKNDGFIGDEEYETKGSFQLWWDGKKIATRYTDDKIFSDSISGRYWVEKQTGGNAYDGSLLSRKPRFGLYENWFEDVIRWQGRGSLDNLILMLKKQKHIAVNWSIVDVDGNKLFKLLTKNMNETAPDYGTYGVEYYDPSKGYGLANQEWYNSQNQLRMKHTVKLEQVIPDGWFPVEIDLKSIAPKQGKIRLHNHFELDLKRCSFNDPSAIPEGIFEVSTAKEQERLNKILNKFSEGATADGADENVQSVCKSVENYIAAALAGEDEKAATFAHPETAVATQTDDTREALQGQQVQIVGACAGDWNALVISSVILADRGSTGSIVFHLKKVILEKEVHWLIDDIDLETLDTIEQEIKNFLSKNPKAKMVIVKPQRPVVDPDRLAGDQTDVQLKVRSALSIDKMKRLGLAVCMYAEEHDDNLPHRLQELKPYIGDGQHFNWLLQNIEYFGKGKSAQRHAAQIPIAYDKALLEETNGTNVLFLDFSVRFLEARNLKELGISRETILRVESAEKLKRLGVAVIMYADDHDDRLPDTLQALKPYIADEQDFQWVVNNVKYLGKGKNLYWHKPWSTPVAYDKTLIEKQSGTNVLFLDGHVEYVQAERLEKLGISKPKEKLGNDRQTIKRLEMLKMRQDYINDDPIVKALSKIVANAEAELILARQKLADSHPELRQKAYYLQVLKKRLDERITTAGKSFDDIMLPEPNLPLAPEVTLITKTFVEAKLPEVLQDIASMAGIPIIPDEKVVGLITTELKDVSLEQALDIVLAPTPYVVKKTPYYYLVGPAVELPEIQKRVESAKKLSDLGRALLIYANDHEDKYPDSLQQLKEYLKEDQLKWALANVNYFGKAKTIAVPPSTPIAYDRTLLQEGKGTNVLYNDGHVEFVKPEDLKKLGISKPAIQIESRILSVSEEFLKDIGLDPNSIQDANAWPEPAPFVLPASNGLETYSLILDDLNVNFLLRATQAHEGAKVHIEPRVTLWDGETATISISNKFDYISGYTGPIRPFDKSLPKFDSVEQGNFLTVKPEITSNKENIYLEFESEIRRLEDMEERKYKGKYKYQIPQIDVIRTTKRAVVPDGKTLLVVGQKITEEVTLRSGVPILGKIPVIGGLFRSSAKVKGQRILLILVKPTILPQEQAEAIGAEKVDSEEPTEPLVRQLEYRLKRAAEPK